MVGIFSRFSASRASHRRTQSAIVRRILFSSPLLWWVVAACSFKFLILRLLYFFHWGWLFPLVLEFVWGSFDLVFHCGTFLRIWPLLFGLVLDSWNLKDHFLNLTLFRVCYWILICLILDIWAISFGYQLILSPFGILCLGFAISQNQVWNFEWTHAMELLDDQFAFWYLLSSVVLLFKTNLLLICKRLVRLSSK